MSIITDIAALRQVSVPFSENKTLVKEKILKLIENLPEHGIGLSSCQIGEFDRVFIAKLSHGVFGFVNPKITNKSSQLFTSTEGCLSIPDISRNISRHIKVNIEADVIFDVKNNQFIDKIDELRYLDAAIIQHECDHLDGILITDKVEVKTDEEKMIERTNKRLSKIEQRKSKNKKTPKINLFKEKTMKEIDRMLKKDNIKLTNMLKIRERENQEKQS